MIKAKVKVPAVVTTLPSHGGILASALASQPVTDVMSCPCGVAGARQAASSMAWRNIKTWNNKNKEFLHRLSIQSFLKKRAL